MYPKTIILKWKNHFKKNKIKRGTSTINYYANQVTYNFDNFILAGDIELNQRPGLHPKRKVSKCNVCDKAVGTNRKRVKCNVCHNLTHFSYLIISKHQQRNCTVKTVPLMTRNECLQSTLPFFKMRDINASCNTETRDHPSATTR